MFEEHENNVVLNENSVEGKPCIDGESKSDEITIYLYSCHDINMKILSVVTPPSIYQYSGTGLIPGRVSIMKCLLSLDIPKMDMFPLLFLRNKH